MISKKGFTVREETDIQNAILDDLAVEFPNMSKERNNALVVLANILSREISNNENNRLEAYNNAYVATATGIHLDRAVLTAGVQRIYGTSSYGVCKFTKESGQNVVIPPSILIESEDLKFITLNTSFVTVTDEGVDIEVKSIETGDIYNLTAGSTFKPVINIRGLKSITNTKNLEGGTNTETDQQLRARYYSLINSVSNCSLNGIIALVARLQDVTRVGGRENVQDVESNGLPPHSFELFIEGSSQSILAKYIQTIKPAGIQTHGSITENVVYEGYTYPIKFSRFNKQNVYYKLNIRTTVGTSTETLEQKIKESLIRYTQINEVINHSEIVGNLYNTVEGIASIKELKFGQETNPQGDSELVAGSGIAFFTDESKIEITFTTR